MAKHTTTTTRASKTTAWHAAAAIVLLCVAETSLGGCAGSRGAPPPRTLSAQLSGRHSPAPRTESAAPLDSLAPVVSATAAADAIATVTQAPPCERTSGPRDLLCYPPYTGPVDEYVTMLDAGIPRFPGYPPLALAKRVQGTVRVRALVGADGSICEAEAIDGPKLLREPALQAAREARIAPAMKDGCPVPIWVEIPFEFKLPPGVAPAKTSK
ncbi:MAG: energy transducer TonB [bacterium]